MNRAARVTIALVLYAALGLVAMAAAIFATCWLVPRVLCQLDRDIPIQPLLAEGCGGAPAHRFPRARRPEDP